MPDSPAASEQDWECAKELEVARRWEAETSAALAGRARPRPGYPYPGMKSALLVGGVGGMRAWRHLRKHYRKVRRGNA